MNSKIVTLQNRNQLGAYLIIFGLFFFINPILGIILASAAAASKNNTVAIKPLVIFLVLYLSALNTTKVHDSDMFDYIDMFNRVPLNGYKGTLGFLSIDDSPKDIVYSTLVYILYYVLFGNQYLFIFAISCLTFLFAFLSVYRFNRSYGTPNYLIVAELLTLAFFTQYFSLSFHLVRQELATSVFFFALSYKNQSLWKFIIWSSVSIMVHSSLAIIILLGFIPFMNRQLYLKEIAVLVAFAISFMFVFSFLGDFVLSRVSLSGEALTNVNRMANMEGAHDATDGSGTEVIIVASILMGVLSFFDIIRRRKMIYPIVVNLCFVWSVLILSLSASPILQYRFFFIEYTFLPFIFYLPFKGHNLIRKPVCLLVVSFLFVRFFMLLNGVFHYTSVHEALLDPFFMLIKLS